MFCTPRLHFGRSDGKYEIVRIAVTLLSVLRNNGSF